MAAAKVKVRVVEHRSVVVDGRALEAGEETEVTPAEAKTLVADGYVELVKPRRKT